MQLKRLVLMRKYTLLLLLVIASTIAHASHYRMIKTNKGKDGFAITQETIDGSGSKARYNLLCLESGKYAGLPGRLKGKIFQSPTGTKHNIYDLMLKLEKMAYSLKKEITISAREDEAISYSLQKLGNTIIVDVYTGIDATIRNFD